MRLLLTNDDGIDAPGLKALEDSIKTQSDMEYIVVAPDGERSACSHSMSLGRPVDFKKIDSKHYAHSGSVADGVYWALVEGSLFTPDMVLSGINLGGNLGEDVIYSGTVAGAREAVLRDVHGLAISLTDGDDFSLAAMNVCDVVRKLLSSSSSPRLLNLNYPAGNFTGPIVAPLGNRPYLKRVKKDESKYGYFLGGPLNDDAILQGNTDTALNKDGVATITPLLINQTDNSHVLSLSKIVKF